MDKILEKAYQVFRDGAEVKIDSRKIESGDIFIAIKGDKFDGNNFALDALEKGASLIILDNPKKYKDLDADIFDKILLVDDSIIFLQELAKKYRNDLKIPILGITGSNGKTTTKELVSVVLSEKYNILFTKGNLNNHIGVPLTILSIKSEHNFAIIEMGANHLNEIKILAEIAKPDFGIITNVSGAHIGEFGSLENIIKTKKELYDEVLKNKGKIFINPKDQTLMEMAKDFLPEDKVYYQVGRILKSYPFLEVEIAGQKVKTKLVGDYNLFNIQASFTVGGFLGLSSEKISQRISEYQPKNNRSQKEKTERGNEVIWDCYNANPVSMKLAIESFSNFSNRGEESIFILGQMAELGQYSEKEHSKVLEQVSKIAGQKFLIGEEFLKLQKDFPSFKYFSSVERLEEFLENNSIENKRILVKGSNSTKLFKLKDENHL